MAKKTLKDIDARENTGDLMEETMAVSEEKMKVTQESVYPVKELAANARKIFGTRQECVIAALKVSGKSECTVSEAKKIVEKFLSKEVK